MIEFEVEEKFVSNPGDRYRDVYTPKIDADGSIELVVTGKEDLWELHNADKDYCDLNRIVESSLNGDSSALQRGNPAFIDILGAPKTLAEAYEINFRAEHAFNNLPSKIKERFGNSFMQFLEGAGSPEWFDLLKIDDPQNEVKASDVNE